MRRSIFAVLAILGLSLAFGAFSPCATAMTQIHPPHDTEGASS
ncbi:MAG TPA: hypothetical protein VFL55_24650 [Acetobacteraceae bacterium]|nr:hypothetical protein [Acetobacteraceae bacterium]